MICVLVGDLFLSAGRMRNLCSLALGLAAAMASVVPRVEAASLSVTPPEQVTAGWTRIAGRYEGGTLVPAFRAIVRCGAEQADIHVLDGHVYLALEERAVWIDLPGTPDRLAPEGIPCEAPELSIEMLVDATVVARVPVSPRRMASVEPAPTVLPASSPPLAPARRLRLKGQKYAAPFTKRTEAGVEWALDSRVSIQLNYERTAQAPMMPFDHDDGVVTRLQVGF